jgi:L-lysine exporter family protein LysE/ArgO
MSSPSIAVLASGLAFGLSLIVAIGAQNAFVIRQGALRQHVGVIVLICTVSDVALIAAGVAGAGVVFDGHPTVFAAVRIAGAAALLAYAALAARRALRASTLSADAERTQSSRAAVIGACLAFTWLNPAVYVDTVVLLGSVSNSAHGQRWTFGLGAAIASALWFVALGFGSGLLAPVLRTPRAWRIVDVLVAAIMTITAARLLAGA